MFPRMRDSCILRAVAVFFSGDGHSIPAKYNTRSELKATVKDGKNTFDWPLKSN